MIQDLGFWGERDKAQSKRSGSERGGPFPVGKADEQESKTSRLGDVAASPKTQILNHEVYNKEL